MNRRSFFSRVTGILAGCFCGAAVTEAAPLLPAVHDDSTPAMVTSGSLIVGTSEPKSLMSYNYTSADALTFAADAGRHEAEKLREELVAAGILLERPKPKPGVSLDERFKATYLAELKAAMAE